MQESFLIERDVGNTFHCMHEGFACLGKYFQCIPHQKIINIK